MFTTSQPACFHTDFFLRQEPRLILGSVDRSWRTFFFFREGLLSSPWSPKNHHTEIIIFANLDLCLNSLNPFWVVVSNIFYFHLHLGEDSKKLTHIFQRDWFNHQPALPFQHLWTVFFFSSKSGMASHTKVLDWTRRKMQLGWRRRRKRSRRGRVAFQATGRRWGTAATPSLFEG